jgi:hypothetical protein
LVLYGLRRPGIAVPWFVHCHHGSDRTGMMVAVYRAVVQGWPMDKAIDEMINGGFGFHEIYRPFTVPFLKRLDIEALKGGVK